MQKKLIQSFLFFILFFFECNDTQENIQSTNPPPSLLISMSLSELTPSSGPSIGGTKVILKGEGFPTDVKVMFENEPANKVEWISDTEIHAVSPALPGVQGVVSVRVIDAKNHHVSTEKKFSYFTSDLQFTAKGGYLLDDYPQMVIPVLLQDHYQLAISTQKDQKTKLYSWNRETSSLSPIGSSLLEEQASVSTLGDFNGDGLLDLVLGNQIGTISILFQDGKGGFLSPHTLVAATDLKWVDVIDVNQDGALDLVTISGNQATTLLNNKRGGFVFSAGTFIGQNPKSFALGDINYDGKPDLVVVANQKLYLALGNGDGTFQIPYPKQLDVTPQSVALADLNQDGKVDLILGATDPMTKKNQLFLGLSQEDETQKVSLFSTAGFADTIAVGDLNGDTFLDVVIMSSSISSASIFLGTDTGTVEPSRDFNPGMSSRKTMIADLNGDQKPDLVMIAAGDSSSSMSVLLNNSQ